jgi:uncharacterized protein
MTIEWDVPIEIDDGVTLRADVFPADPAEHLPDDHQLWALRLGLPFQESFAPAWQKMIIDYPEVLAASSGKECLPKPTPGQSPCLRISSRQGERSPIHLWW